ncbi:unnamed protein product [Paramecium pentaurelia]|uniref:Uncharacterized protein n=1 Tax=Paramecium pentaurelia TaxID=43138 RepID=A0A8S1TGG8_9CILI|nr:unnamed protein product [Paramecium pentaurelia]
MKFTILFVILIAFSNAQEDSPGTSAPMQLEVEQLDNTDEREENAGIFQGKELKKGMGPMDQFFLKDLFETITSAFDDFADNPNDSTFLQSNQQSQQINESDESVIQFESPMLGLFNPLFSIFSTEGDSDFVEIETISINGQTQTKVTKTSTRNGITTTTTEITTQTPIQELNSDQANKLSDDFQLFESPITDDVLNKSEIIQQQDETEQITQVNLDNLDSIQELHLIQDNYVKNDQQVNLPLQADNNLALRITIVCGLSLAAVIGFLIKKCAFKTK